MSRKLYQHLTQVNDNYKKIKKESRDKKLTRAYYRNIHLNWVYYKRIVNKRRKRHEQN